MRDLDPTTTTSASTRARGKSFRRRAVVLTTLLTASLAGISAVTVQAQTAPPPRPIDDVTVPPITDPPPPRVVEAPTTTTIPVPAIPNSPPTTTIPPNCSKTKNSIVCVEDIVINGEPQPAPPSLPPDPVDEICSGHPEACDPPDDSPPPSPDDGDGLAPSIAAPPAEQPQPTAPNIAAPVAGLAESTVAETITIDHPAVRTVLRRVQAVMLDAYVEHLALHTTEFRVAVAPSSKMGEPELICEETRDGGIVCVEWEIISCTGPICGDDDEENSTPGVAGRLASSALLSDAVGDITLDPEVWEHDGPGMSCMDLDCAIEFIQWCNALGGSSATEEGEGDGWEMNCDLDSQSF